MDARRTPIPSGAWLALGLAAALAGPPHAVAQALPIPGPQGPGVPLISPMGGPANDEAARRAFQEQRDAFMAYQQCIAAHRAEVDIHYAAQQVIDIRDRRESTERLLAADPRMRERVPGGYAQLVAQAFSHYKAVGGTAATVEQVQPVATPCPTPGPRMPERRATGGPSPITQSRQLTAPPGGGPIVPPPPPQPQQRVPMPDLTTQDPARQVEIGIMYRFGRVPMTQDSKEAERWFQKAAAGGYAPALNALGDLYNSGASGLPRNAREAVKWYRQAADKGNSDAMFSLGELNLPGHSQAIWSDATEAARWFRMAAERGHVLAMVRLARAYQTGEGVALDKDQALNWYRKAAEKGNAVSGSWVKLAEACVRQGRPATACM